MRAARRAAVPRVGPYQLNFDRGGENQTELTERPAGLGWEQRAGVADSARWRGLLRRVQSGQARLLLRVGQIAEASSLKAAATHSVVDSSTPRS